MSCELTTCTIWHECDKAMGSELKPACASENKEAVSSAPTNNTSTEIADRLWLIAKNCADLSVARELKLLAGQLRTS